MSRKKSKQTPKRVLRLPDLDFAKSAVLKPPVAGVEAIVSVHHRRFCGVVLLGATDRVQQDSGASVLRCRLELESRPAVLLDNQPPACGRAAARI